LILKLLYSEFLVENYCTSKIGQNLLYAYFKANPIPWAGLPWETLGTINNRFLVKHTHRAPVVRSGGGRAAAVHASRRCQSGAAHDRRWHHRPGGRWRENATRRRTWHAAGEHVWRLSHAAHSVARVQPRTGGVTKGRAAKSIQR